MYSLPLHTSSSSSWFACTASYGTPVFRKEYGRRFSLFVVLLLCVCFFFVQRRIISENIVAIGNALLLRTCIFAACLSGNKSAIATLCPASSVLNLRTWK